MIGRRTFACQSINIGWTPTARKQRASPLIIPAMLDPDHIQFRTTVNHGDFLSTVRATLSVNAEMRLSEFAIQSYRGDVMREVQRRLAAQIWQHVYGDLRPAFLTLERHAFAGLHPNFNDKSDAEIANAAAIVRK